MRKWIAAGMFVVSAGVAFAMVRPAEIEGTIKAPGPYGTGALSWLFITAYEASLWTDARAWSMSEPFALTLDYRMSFSTDEIVERTLGEMKKVSPNMPTATLQRYEAMLRRAFPAVKAGDRLTALHAPGQPVRFFHNGRMTADSGEAAFAEPFFAIWLSPRTSEPGLRAALLRLPG